MRDFAISKHYFHNLFLYTFCKYSQRSMCISGWNIYQALKSFVFLAMSKSKHLKPCFEKTKQISNIIALAKAIVQPCHKSKVIKRWAPKMTKFYYYWEHVTTSLNSQEYEHLRLKLRRNRIPPLSRLQIMKFLPPSASKACWMADKSAVWCDLKELDIFSSILDFREREYSDQNGRLNKHTSLIKIKTSVQIT